MGIVQDKSRPEERTRQGIESAMQVQFRTGLEAGPPLPAANPLLLSAPALPLGKSAAIPLAPFLSGRRRTNASLAETRILCVFTTILGHKTMVRRLVQALNKLPAVQPTFVFLEPEDYLQIPVPKWSRLTNPWHAQAIARLKAKAFLRSSYDMLLLNAWESVVAFRDLGRKLPTAALLDAVPETFHRQLEARGVRGWKREAAHRIHDWSFRIASRNVDLFLPMGSDCAESLQRHYSVDSTRCLPPTLAPQDLYALQGAAPAAASPLRLLFVGNDFLRKGGDFLLRMFAEHLAGACLLTIVSSDPALDSMSLPEGVRRLRNLTPEQLRPLYEESHLFVFPTRQDFMPQVLAEALAAGLPCMANDVGGIGDLVQHGDTGFLMPLHATPAVWAGHILNLASNPRERIRMACCSRQFAESKLGMERFESLVREAVAKLRALGYSMGSRPALDYWKQPVQQ